MKLESSGAKKTPPAHPSCWAIRDFMFVMAGHSRPKDGVASLAFVPAIHALWQQEKGVDARHKAGHDVERLASAA